MFCISQGNKTNIVGNADSEEISSGNSSRSPSSSSGYPINNSNMPSRSTDAMSPTSTLTSLCEDADSGISAFIHILNAW